jgi:hypothetical protein
MLTEQAALCVFLSDYAQLDHWSTLHLRLRKLHKISLPRRTIEVVGSAVFH